MHGLKQKLGEAIGKDLDLTEMILKVESESPRITYGEFLELCNKSVENRTNLIVELRGLYPEMDYQLKTGLVDYLSAENEFVRAKRDSHGKSMELSSTFDAYVELVKKWLSSSKELDFYVYRLLPMRVKLRETAREARKER